MLCQRILILFSLLNIVSCAAIKETLLGEETLVITERVEAKPWWFDGPERLTPRNRENSPPVHSFFDFVPFSKVSDREINVVLTTLKGSDFNYKLDPYSGKLFRSHDYCPQEDVWQSYEKEIHRPPYTEAVVPRLIDQIGEPQKVIVFGDNKYFLDYSLEADRSFRVRILGGVIEQYCAIFPCDLNDRWLSRMILVAVNIDDPKFKRVRAIHQLKQKVDWDEVIAFMQNGEGRSVADKKELPSYRIVGEIGSHKAMLYAMTKGHFFTFDELQAVRNSCWKLYDYTWKASEFVRAGKGKTKEDLLLEFEAEKGKKLIELFDKRVVNDESEKELKIDEKDLILENYASFFKYYMRRYGKSFDLCRRFVSHSNIKDNIERHWYFTQLSLYMDLIRHNYIYNCEKEGWVKNVVQNDGSLSLDPVKELKNCTTKQIDSAFSTGLVQMVTLKKTIASSNTEYIEYDNGFGGSHQLLNSLVFRRGKKLSCTNSGPFRKVTNEILPEDVEWQPFYKDIKYKSIKNLIK